MPLVEATPELLPVTAPTSVLQKVRLATAKQHKALEARLPLMSSELNIDDYRRIIEAYYGFHLPLQQRIEAFLGTDLTDPERLKIPALLKDLSALGLNSAQINALAMCDRYPSIDTHARLLGVMYVMEGATLGGQVLRRVIHEKLGIDAQTGAEFLDVYGRDTGRLWKAFLKQLADFNDPEQDDEVCAAACATFACFERWLEQVGVLHDV